MKKIEWTQHTWNPIRGCSPVSAGCDNCYAERIAKRFKDRTGPFNQYFEPTTIPERLDQPLHWKKPRMVFVGSMGDLFHEKIPDEFIFAVFKVMANCQQHIFQLLTKRPQRMKFMLESWFIKNTLTELTKAEKLMDISGKKWPLPNVWLGITTENQQTADERIPILLETPAAKRFVSLEPMLGPIDLMHIIENKYITYNCIEGCGVNTKSPCQSIPNIYGNKIDWVIVGGETGPGARSCREGWVEYIYDQCKAADVPFFFKQKGKNWEPCPFWGTGMPMELNEWEKRREWPK